MAVTSVTVETSFLLLSSVFGFSELLYTFYQSVVKFQQEKREDSVCKSMDLRIPLCMCVCPWHRH